MANYRVIRWAGLWWCLCAGFLWSVTADAASRVRPPMPPAASHLGSGSASRDATSIAVRGPLSGQYIPYAGGGGRKMHIPVSADYYWSIPRTFNQAKGFLRTNLYGIGIGFAVAGIIEGLDWILDDDGYIKKHEIQCPEGYESCEILATDYPASGMCGNYPYAINGFNQIKYVRSSTTVRIGGVTYPKGTLVEVKVVTNDGSSHPSAINNCIDKYKDSRWPTSETGHFPVLIGTIVEIPQLPQQALVPITAQDVQQIDQFLDADAGWIRDLLQNSCEGSSNPAGCVESLMDKTELSGPASLTSPSTTTTTTTTGPDGVTGVSTTTTNTTYNITYGSDYYEYNTTKTTTTVGPDGTTTTETQTETAADGEPTPEEEAPTQETPKPCSDNCEGPAYEDMYTPIEDTKESLADSYLARVQAIPLFAAVGGFFDVSVSAGCPVWQTELSMNIFGESFAYSLVFDYHCQPWFVELRPFCLAVFMIFGAGVAFRIAIL